MQGCATMHRLVISERDLFQALADPTRIRIVRLLAETNEEACLCDFSDALLEPSYKLSRHLKILKQAGLLTATREGRFVYHRLISKASYLKHLYAMICEMPVQNPNFKRELKHFKTRISQRKAGRYCSEGIASTK